MKKAFLCVDDENIILGALKSQLKRYHNNDLICETATSADEAFEIIQELNEKGIEILIIVSDWLMPGIKGDEFLIRVHRDYPDIIKMMLSGHVDENSVENARKNANLFACIAKPWTEEELFRVLDEALK